MMDPKKAIVFDTGPLISMTMSGTIWIIEKLKQAYPGKFIITKSVKMELVDSPLHTHKFKFESIRVMPYIANGILTLVDDDRIRQKAQQIQQIANTTFVANNTPIKVMHIGEAESVAACLLFGAKTIVIDERTTRYLIEAPEKVKKRLEKKLKTNISVNKQQLHQLKDMLSEIQPIRSTELLTIAFEKGLLHFYEFANINKDPKFRHEVLDGVLWALKMAGCAISENEIYTILKEEKV